VYPVRIITIKLPDWGRFVGYYAIDVEGNMVVIVLVSNSIASMRFKKFPLLIVGIEEANKFTWFTPRKHFCERYCESETIAALSSRLGDYNESEGGGEGHDFLNKDENYQLKNHNLRKISSQSRSSISCTRKVESR
jgi:hypothetical protein